MTAQGLTRESISEMVAGPEMDELIGIHVTKVIPRNDFRAMNKDETGIIANFEYKHDADKWMKEHEDFWPKYVSSKGIHIVPMKIYPHYSEHDAVALSLIDFLQKVEEINGKKIRLMVKIIAIRGKYSVAIIDYLNGDVCEAECIGTFALAVSRATLIAFCPAEVNE